MAAITFEQLISYAKSLSVVDQHRLVDELMGDWEPIDPTLEAKWVSIAEARYRDYKSGLIQAEDWNNIGFDLLK